MNVSIHFSFTRDDTPVLYSYNSFLLDKLFVAKALRMICICTTNVSLVVKKLDVCCCLPSEKVLILSMLYIRQHRQISAQLMEGESRRESNRPSLHPQNDCVCNSRICCVF